MATFKSTSTADKVDRLFKIIDEDGNGSLSFQEICNLVQRSLSAYTQIGQDALSDEERRARTQDEMSVNMPAYFASYIFDQIGVSPDQELTLDKISEMLQKDQNGLELLEMFCGEGAVDIV